MKCRLFYISTVYIAILDLQKLLAKHKDKTPSKNPLDIPRHLILQFDNCAENKVMFVIINYLSIIYILYILCVLLCLYLC